MTTAKKILSVAVKELGNKEQPAESNRTKYGKWYGMDGQPWCAMFVSWVFERGGLPLPVIQSQKGFAYCPYGRKYYKRQRQLFSKPKVGDLVFFRFGNSLVSNHVGIVESVNRNGTVTTIEGNTSRTSDDNGGKVMRRIRNLSICYGFARPNYSGFDEPLPRIQRLLKLNKGPYMMGGDVLEYQRLLKAKGYQIDDDGVFGPQTNRITRQFQKDRGLEIDGIVGMQTMAAARSQ